MKKLLGFVLFAAVAAFAGVLIDEASQCGAPDADEIYALFEDDLPAPETADPPELTEPVLLRGWKVWLGNYPRYERVKGTPLDRRHDPGDRERDIRIYREPETRGARLRNAWLTITGQAP